MAHTLVSCFYVFHTSSLLTDPCAVLLPSALRECRLRNQRNCPFQSVVSGRLNQIRKQRSGKNSVQSQSAICIISGSVPENPGRQDLAHILHTNHSIVNTNTCPTSTSQVKIYLKSSKKNSYMFRSSTVFRELQCPR